nr:hypothetical protein [Tanacetum cinerariifolium]
MIERRVAEALEAYRNGKPTKENGYEHKDDNGNGNGDGDGTVNGIGVGGGNGNGNPNVNTGCTVPVACSVPGQNVALLVKKTKKKTKSDQKREAWRSWEKFKAVAVDKGRKTEENAKRMVENAYTVKKLFKL